MFILKMKIRLSPAHPHASQPAVSKVQAGVVPQGRERLSCFLWCKQMSKKQVKAHECCAQSKPRAVSWREETEQRNEPRGEQGAGAPSSQVVTGRFTALSKEQVG